ncbi:MAG: nadE, partial [Modestobacter sp.]|nr:nadE [Modestobacter sp.]
MTAPVQLRVALAQVDTRVGDLDGNADLVVDWTRRATEEGAHLVVFPEMTLTGYPAEDLVLRESFARASEHTLVSLATTLSEQGLGGTAVVVGYLAHTEGTGPAPVDRVPTDADDHPGDANPRRGAPRNAAALLHGGAVVARYYKRHLPNYGVFDEARYFVPGTELPVVRLHGVDVALTICEDAWNPAGPILDQADSGAELIVNLNASPYAEGKLARRERMMATRAADASCALVYVNQVGGQDELVFDGGSMVFDAGGALLARSPQFVEDVMIVDLDVEPVYRKRLLDPRGRPSDLLLPIEATRGEEVEATEARRNSSEAPLLPAPVAEHLD